MSAIVLPQRFWDWYADHQTELCPVTGHGVMSAHTMTELVKCALAKKVIDPDEVPDDYIEELHIALDKQCDDARDRDRK